MVWYQSIFITQRTHDVTITSLYIKTTSQHRFDALLTLLLRHVSYELILKNRFVGIGVLMKPLRRTLQWRHNGRGNVSNHQPHECLLNRLFKENIKAPRHWPFLWGIHREPVNSPHKGPVTRKMFPFDDVIMIWANLCQTNLHNWFHNHCKTTTNPNLYPQPSPKTQPKLGIWKMKNYSRIS